jgi:hypothetical protein
MRPDHHPMLPVLQEHYKSLLIMLLQHGQHGVVAALLLLL